MLGSSPQTHERMRGKKTVFDQADKSSFDLADLLKGSQGPSKLPDDTLRTTVVREKCYYFSQVIWKQLHKEGEWSREHQKNSANPKNVPVRFGVWQEIGFYPHFTV